MKIIYLNYFYSNINTKPNDWLQQMQPVNIVLEQLAKKHTVTSIQQINDSAQLTKNGVNYQFVNFYNQKTWLPFRLNLFVKRLCPNIIIIHGTVFPLQTILLRLVIGSNVKIFIQHHAELPFKGVKRRLQKMASFMVNGYFFPSIADGLNWQQKGNIYAQKPIFNVHEGASVYKKIDVNTAKSFTKVSGQPTYIWVGRLDANKQPLLAIKAFSKFLQTQPSAKLYMLFYRAELLTEIQQYLAQNSALIDKIILVGKVAAADMAYWYSSADYYISSSLKEGTSFSLCEAMACYCIPIVSNINTHNNMLGDCCGFTYQVGNEEDLLATLIACAKASRAQESEKVKHQYLQHLTATAITNIIENAISNVL
jgi:glycosyltransferase involved in cell wall biosynthesis